MDPLQGPLPEAFEQEGFGNADGHIHGVHLVDDREQIGLRGHQSPFIDPGALDQPSDGRGNAGIVEVELGPHQLRLGVFQRRLRRQFFGDGIIHILLAHRLLGEQRFNASLVLLGLHQPCLGLSHHRLGAHRGGLEGHGIDLIEQVALLDVAAFLEKALFDDTRHLGADLHGAGGLGFPDEFGFVNHRLTRHGDNGNFRDGSGGRSGGFLLAGC